MTLREPRHTERERLQVLRSRGVPVCSYAPVPVDHHAHRTDSLGCGRRRARGAIATAATVSVQSRSCMTSVSTELHFSTGLSSLRGYALEIQLSKALNNRSRAVGALASAHLMMFGAEHAPNIICARLSCRELREPRASREKSSSLDSQHSGAPACTARALLFSAERHEDRVRASARRASRACVARAVPTLSWVVALRP